MSLYTLKYDHTVHNNTLSSEFCIVQVLSEEILTQLKDIAACDAMIHFQ